MEAMKVRQVKDVDSPGLGKRIEDARKADNRSLREIAKLAGMTCANWYVIEREQVRGALPIETLRRIEQALGVDFGVTFED